MEIAYENMHHKPSLLSKSAAQVIFYSLFNNFLDINDFFHEIPLTAKAHNGSEVEGSSWLKFSVHVLRAYLLLTKGSWHCGYIHPNIQNGGREV